MRRLFMNIAIAITTTVVLQAAPRDLKREGREVPGASWVMRAGTDGPIRAEFEFTADVPAGNRPIVLIETNYYTFLPNEAMQVRVTLNANGYSAPVTMYLYQENRVTAGRRYWNIGANALLPAGQSADLFGSAGSAIPVLVPNLSDFVLFGTASDPAERGWGLAGALGPSVTVPSGQTGLYQWVLELRDAAGKRVVARSNAMYSFIEGQEAIQGTITANTTWTANRRYILNDFVGVVAPAVLMIEPGTVIYGGTTRASLFIQRGARINASGTLRRPIIFTSAQKIGERRQQDWGGLVLLGNAPINVPTGTAFLEGLPSEAAYSYGGTDPADSSGTVRYVRLEFGGFPIVGNQEINGLTLGGVGSGTVLDYIEVIHNKDDAFEFFGGTVNASHLLAVAIADDALDFDFGYRGSIQFVAMIKRAENDEGDSNSTVESDNNASGGADLPLTSPRVYNVTSVRVPGNTGLHGMNLRRNTGGEYRNVIITGTRVAPVTIRNDNTVANLATGALSLDSSILFGSFEDSAFTSLPSANPPGSDRPSETRNYLFAAGRLNRNTDPLLAIGTPTLIETYMPDLTPLNGSPALDAGFVSNPPDDGFLEPVDYIGAVGPGDNWVLSGWATFSDN